MKLNPTSKNILRRVSCYLDDDDYTLLENRFLKLEEQIRKLKKNLKKAKLYTRKYPT